MLIDNLKLKIKDFLIGILIPIIIYVFIILLVTIISKILFKPNTYNNILLQGVANLILIFILLPYYKKFINVKYNNVIPDLRKVLYLIPLGYGLSVSSNILLSFFIDISQNIVTKEINELINLPYGIIFVLLTSIIIAPIIEELIFRGFIFDTFYKISNIYIAIFISSLFFAFAHGNIEQGIYAFVAGIVLCYIRYTFSSIKYSVILHIAMNFLVLFSGSAIVLNPSFKNKIFQLIISLIIFILALIRIININKESEDL